MDVLLPNNRWIASDTVTHSPLTKKKVAPNSPIDIANEKSIATSIADFIIGKITQKIYGFVLFLKITILM